MRVYRCRRAFLIGLAVACGAFAQELPPVKPLPHTIGSASKIRGPLMFCAVPDASLMRAAYHAAAQPAPRPFAIGWELKADPPKELARIVVITTLRRAGDLVSENCKRVQHLPSGGADAMQLHTP